MTRRDKVYERMRAQLRAYLSNHNLRWSPKRDFILHECCYSVQPFDKATIMSKALSNGISRAAFYNTFNMLVDLHMIRTSDVDKLQQVEFEVVAPRQTRFIRVCTVCQKEWKFNDPVIQKHIQSREYFNFTMADSAVYVYGKCKACENKEMHEALKRAEAKIEKEKR